MTRVRGGGTAQAEPRERPPCTRTALSHSDVLTPLRPELCSRDPGNVLDSAASDTPDLSLRRGVQRGQTILTWR